MVSHAPQLGRPKLVFFGWVPADCRRIEENLGSLQGRQPGGFGIPLIPAHKRPHAGIRRVKRSESKVARGEIVLFVVEWVIRNVHLAVDSTQGAVAIEHNRRVVIKSWPRRSKIDPTITILVSWATCARASVVGPGMGSASSNRVESSDWQK